MVGAVFVIQLLAADFFGLIGDLAVFLFKCTDALSDQVQNLSVGGAALIFGDVAKLKMQFRVHFDAQMLVLLVSHVPPHPQLVETILRLF